MGKGGFSKECGRVILWMSWVSVWLITSIYVALAVITFGKLWQAATELNYGAQQLALSKVWRSPLAALVLSALLVFGFNIASCAILVKKSVNRGGPGFSYGFMVAFAFALSFFLLLSGLVLDGFRDEVKTNLTPTTWPNGTTTGATTWDDYSTESYIGTEVFALISFCIYFLFAVLLVILQVAISDQLGIQGAGGKSGRYSAADVMTSAVPLHDADAVPAAPPDYDQYAQYEQYNQYADNQQAYYGQQQEGYHAPSGTVPQAPDGEYYNGQYKGYAPQGEDSAMQVPAPQNMASAQYASAYGWGGATAGAAPTAVAHQGSFNHQGQQI